MVVVSNNPEEAKDAATVLDGRSQQQSIRKNPLTEEAYRNITGSMRAEPLQIESPKTALQLLYTATQLQNMPLVNECIKNLDEHLDRDTVLMIYAHLSRCKLPCANRDDFEPSAPPIIENESQRGTDWVLDLVSNLRHNCLLVIDKDADYVLMRRKELDELAYADMLSIVERDTLEVSDEQLVYAAILSWGIAECKRMTLSTLHLQEVLRQLRFAPRYGLMTRKAFCARHLAGGKGPTRSGVLDEKEWRQIRFFLEQRAKHKSVNELEHRMSQARCVGGDKPKILSCKSSQRFEEASSTTTTTTTETATKVHTEGEIRQRDRCIINLLACWTAFFD